MATNNLIALKQIRNLELSGFVDSIVSGYIGLYGLNRLTGNSTGTSIPLSSAVESVVLFYPNPIPGAVPVGVLGTSGANDPIVHSQLFLSNSTGCTFDFSAPLPSSNYYMNIMIAFPIR